MFDKQRMALVETKTQESGLLNRLRRFFIGPETLIRYQLGNHLGSAGLELDDEAQIISYEEYYPYGSTTYQAVRSQTEASKRYCYTGKERDEESGFYYHGARYYSPSLSRWITTDPIGIQDDFNLYRFVMGNPLRLNDPNGTQANAIDESEDLVINVPLDLQAQQADAQAGMKAARTLDDPEMYEFYSKKYLHLQSEIDPIGKAAAYLLVASTAAPFALAAAGPSLLAFLGNRVVQGIITATFVANGVKSDEEADISSVAAEGAGRALFGVLSKVLPGEAVVYGRNAEEVQEELAKFEQPQSKAAGEATAGKADEITPSGGPLYGHNEYIVADHELVDDALRQLRAFYEENGPGHEIEWVESLPGGVNGAFDPVTGRISLTQDLLGKFQNLREGVEAEELLHFQQVYESGGLRELSDAEKLELEDEVVDLLLERGFKIFDPR